MSDEHPANGDTPPRDRRMMDPHIARVERRLDLIDDVLRGDTLGTPGLLESVRLVSAEQRRQGEALGALRDVPAQLEALTRASGGRDGRLDELHERVGELVGAAQAEAARGEGERAAMNRVAKWLKIAAGVGAALFAGGATGIVALLRSLGEVVQAIP